VLASVGKLSEERKELTPEDDDGRDDEEHGEDGEAAAVDERRQKHPVTDRRLTVPRPTAAVNAHLLLQITFPYLVDGHAHSQAETAMHYPGHLHHS